MTEATHYAKSALDLTNVTSGTDVLVYGASGGIGTAAVQLARLAGANVTASNFVMWMRPALLTA